MRGDKLLAISPKRNWTREQWDIYRRMSWIGRMLVDMMVLTPGMSRWLAERALSYDNKRKTRGRNSPIATSSRHSSSASRPSLRLRRKP